MKNNELMYFPTVKEEIDEYVDKILEISLKNNYEAEKMLLHSLLYMMFSSNIPVDDLSPHTVLYLLQMTAHENQEGHTMVDDLYYAASDDIDNPGVESIYWYLRNAENFGDIVIRLISIYQFYDKYFQEPVFTKKGKVMVYYPRTKKETTYVVPEGVERIASHAFASNQNLNFIKLPKTLKAVGKISFNNLKNLKGIIVDEENKWFYSESGILYKNKEKPTLIKYPSAIKDTFVTIPQKVKKVKAFAFENCNNIKEVRLVSGDTLLEDSAFFACKHITNVAIIDGNSKKLNQKAFNNMVMDEANTNQEASNEFEEQTSEKQTMGRMRRGEDPFDSAYQETTHLDYKTPSVIKQMFDDYIVGHDEAKRTLAVAVFSHIMRCNNEDNQIGKSNIIMCGPTGCGKTEFARTIAKCLNVPFVTADATSITETGMKGNDPTDMLKDLLIAADDDVEKAQKGIIYIDEIDKLATYGENVHRESYSKGVQQGLLKIIEGGIIPLRIENPMAQYTVNFDTSNILFIVGGAFSGLTSENPAKENKQIGFAKNTVTKETETKKLEAKDFIKYGMTQEFIGRFPVIVQLQQLSENEIYRIMIEPKNSVISQYKKLVSCIGSELIFEEELLHSIANNAVKTGTGARGIRTVIEQLVENIIFDLPDKKNIKEVIVHKGMLEKEQPKYISK